MKRAFSAAVATVLVLLMIGAGVVSVSLGRIVKSAVEAAGPRLLGAPVSLDSAAISPFSGRGTLRGLVIGNPPGFQGPRAASVASMEVEINLASLLSGTVVVERLAVRDPELLWEIGPNGSNLAALQRNAEASAGKLGGGPASAPATAPPPAGKSLLIRDFSVTGGKVGVTATVLGGRGLGIALPDVRLTNLGGRGRSPSEAAAQAFGAIANAAQGAVSNAGGRALDRVRGAAVSALGVFFKRGGK